MRGLNARNTNEENSLSVDYDFNLSYMVDLRGFDGSDIPHT